MSEIEPVKIKPKHFHHKREEQKNDNKEENVTLSSPMSTKSDIDTMAFMTHFLSDSDVSGLRGSSKRDNYTTNHMTAVRHRNTITFDRKSSEATYNSLEPKAAFNYYDKKVDNSRINYITSVIIDDCSYPSYRKGETILDKKLDLNKLVNVTSLKLILQSDMMDWLYDNKEFLKRITKLEIIHQDMKIYADGDGEFICLLCEMVPFVNAVEELNVDIPAKDLDYVVFLLFYHQTCLPNLKKLEVHVRSILPAFYVMRRIPKQVEHLIVHLHATTESTRMHDLNIAFPQLPNGIQTFEVRDYVKRTSGSCSCIQIAQFNSLGEFDYKKLTKMVLPFDNIDDMWFPETLSALELICHYDVFARAIMNLIDIPHLIVKFRDYPSSLRKRLKLIKQITPNAIYSLERENGEVLRL